MFKYLSVFLLSSVALTAPAAAQGAKPASFAGPRIELRAGLDRTTLKASYDDGVDSFSAKGHDTGLNVGAELGYDAAISPTIIAGVYAGAELSSTKECSEIYGNDRACLKLGRNLTLGGRLGTQVSRNALFYVKAGYSNGQLKASYTNSDDATLNTSGHSNRSGFHLGIGGEASVGGKSYVRFEYVRTEYNGYRYSDTDLTAKLDGHRDQLLLGVGARF